MEWPGRVSDHSLLMPRTRMRVALHHVPIHFHILAATLRGKFTFCYTKQPWTHIHKDKTRLVPCLSTALFPTSLYAYDLSQEDSCGNPHNSAVREVVTWSGKLFTTTTAAVVSRYLYTDDGDVWHWAEFKHTLQGQSIDVSEDSCIESLKDFSANWESNFEQIRPLPLTSSFNLSFTSSDAVTCYLVPQGADRCEINSHTPGITQNKREWIGRTEQWSNNLFQVWVQTEPH
jgi:hypothetical protein